MVIFFWSYKHRETGYLCNFYPAAFLDKHGMRYICSEQYLVKKKQEFFDKKNLTLGEEIMREIEPHLMRRLALRINNYDPEWWAKIRYHIMYEAILYKFTQHDDLREKLLATGDQILAQASPRDPEWGIGLLASEAENVPEHEWPGLNILGRTIMDVRQRLKVVNNNSCCISP